MKKATTQSKAAAALHKQLKHYFRSQKEIADVLGIARWSVGRKLQRQVPAFSLAQLQKLADHAGVPVTALFDDSIIPPDVVELLPRMYETAPEAIDTIVRAFKLHPQSLGHVGEYAGQLERRLKNGKKNEDTQG